MGSGVEIEISSALGARCDEVWHVISTIDGVNAELHPYVHMTTRPTLRTLPTLVVPGSVVFRSWLLLFGVVPFDRHALALEAVEEGRGFVEESTSWMHRRWRHERHLAPQATGGCVITDRLMIEPRAAILRGVVRVIVEHLFAHRHRRLLNRFGPAAIPLPEA